MLVSLAELPGEAVVNTLRNLPIVCLIFSSQKCRIVMEVG